MMELLLSQPAALNAGFTDWVLDLHYTFLAGHWGMLVTGLLALALCLAGITGLYVYRRFWANLLRLKWGKNSRVFWGDIHKKVGALSSPILLLLGLTGAYWNLTHATRDLVTPHDEQPFTAPMYAEDLSFDALLEGVWEAHPDYRLNYIAIPHEPGDAVSFYGSWRGQSSLRGSYGSTFHFDSDSGELLSSFDIREANAGLQLLDSFEPLHFGNFGGLITKLLWCLLGGTPALLSLSGFWIYWRRGPGRRERAGAGKPREREAVPTAREPTRAAAYSRGGV